MAPTITPEVSAVARDTAEVEHEQLRLRLAEYRRFDPPYFSVSSAKPGAVEPWVRGMERRLEDLFIPKRD